MEKQTFINPLKYIGVSQNWGYHLGGPIIRILVYWGYIGGPLILGNYHISLFPTNPQGATGSLNHCYSCYDFGHPENLYRLRPKPSIRFCSFSCLMFCGHCCCLSSVNGSSASEGNPTTAKMQDILQQQLAGIVYGYC